MGQSTDAILAYGYDFGDPEEEGFPFKPFDEDTDTEQSNPVGYLFFSGRALDGIKGVTHCSGDCPMYIIHADGALIRAWRGSPQVIAKLEAKPEWDAALVAFLAKYKLKTPNPPAWLLASDWS